MTAEWSQDALWQKAKVYAERALEVDRTGPLFPFWMILAAEFLARASVAKVHPVLLADPQRGENLLHVFGLGAGATPKSVPTKTVLERCRRIVPEFTEKEETRLLQLVELRNAELHSGALAFESVPTASWQPEFYRSCRVLLDWQERTLADFLGEEEAAAADTMVEAAESRTIGETKKMLADAKNAFDSLDAAQRAARAEYAMTNARGYVAHSFEAELVQCPSCGSSAAVKGEPVSTSAPRAAGEELVVETVYLPTEFRCFACNLRLVGYDRLLVAGLGGQFSIVREFDPLEYYDDLYAAYEPDYGND